MDGTESGLTMDRFRAGKRLWGRAEDRLLGKRYPHETTARLARELRRSVSSVYNRAWILGLAKSAEYLASADACRLRRGDNVGAACRFQKGHVPANKGLRRPGWAPGRMRETQFKKGERSGVAARNWRPIGTILAGHVWEAAHGPVPKGHAITFRNGDKRDIRLDNLKCISLRELMARNTVHNLPKPLAETIQLLGALNRQIRRRTKAHEEQDRRPA